MIQKISHGDLSDEELSIERGGKRRLIHRLVLRRGERKLREGIESDIQDLELQPQPSHKFNML